jgi:hypothetical protein
MFTLLFKVFSAVLLLQPAPCFTKVLVRKVNDFICVVGGRNTDHGIKDSVFLSTNNGVNVFGRDIMLLASSA